MAACVQNDCYIALNAKTSGLCVWGRGGGGDGVGVGMEGCKHNLRIACIVQSVLQSLYKTTKTNPYFGAEFTDCIYCGTMKISQYILAEFTICM